MMDTILQIIFGAGLIAVSLAFSYSGYLSLPVIILPIWIFHWSIYNPNYAKAYLMIILSVILEFLLGTDMGLLSIPIALTCYSITNLRIQLYPLPFRMIWLAYGLYVIGFVLVMAGLDVIFYGNKFFITSAIVSGAVSISLYPMAISAMVALFGRGVKRNG